MKEKLNPRELIPDADRLSTGWSHFKHLCKHGTGRAGKTDPREVPSEFQGNRYGF